MADNGSESQCPICETCFPIAEIEAHVNKCIFLNCSEETQKRPASPIAGNKAKSPRYNNAPPKPKNFLQSKQLDFKNVPSTSTNGPSTASSTKFSFTVPLAKQVQPKTLDQFFGQSKVLGSNTVLRQLLGKADIPNMILWGPPGCGKTSLSGVVHEICKANPKTLKFVPLNAATCGVKEVQTIIMDAKMQQKFGRKTVLFMDEIHRFNKRQQDIFLADVEKGTITLIGATTENPSFSLNNALLSRCRVIVMEKLETDYLIKILERAVTTLDIKIVKLKDEYSSDDGLTIELDALNWIADTSDGDARIALSNLQLLLQQNDLDKNKLITVEDIKDGIKKSHLLYDRKGEEHYNIISAMHKSIRGSDVNAALYWTTRMIVSGEDPLFIARRLVRAASEDIGNSDPAALQLAVTTMQGCQLLGMPEADVLLAQCAIYLARAPKSREADTALAAAKQVINSCEGLQPSVPMHIRNAPTKLMKELGYGKVASGTKPSFMPAGLENVKFFK
ncbi:PREDICTED: ATPase WRNIP1-like [Nicrophorus vespilloides]|uniref:ATPase WRNIP1-like n=1 Tax=Nicrophorus vespilloides TaxID=110193 RepID=A0ABM1MLJ8_NICVS|nr:PREDICTED: ATPase WRNIP1-like [Nicrophorus vespilloides]